MDDKICDCAGSDGKLTLTTALHRHSTTEALEACEYARPQAAYGSSVRPAEGYGRRYCAVAEGTCGRVDELTVCGDIRLLEADAMYDV